jgi:hypothetical protein
VFLEAIKLFEGAVIEQELDAFARGHLPRRVLTFDAFAPAPFECGGIFVDELAQAVGNWFFFNLALRGCHS